MDEPDTAQRGCLCNATAGLNVKLTQAVPPLLRRPSPKQSRLKRDAYYGVVPQSCRFRRTANSPQTEKTSSAAKEQGEYGGGHHDPEQDAIPARIEGTGKSLNKHFRHDLTSSCGV